MDHIRPQAQCEGIKTNGRGDPKMALEERLYGPAPAAYLAAALFAAVGEARMRTPRKWRDSWPFQLMLLDFPENYWGNGWPRR